jgi:hypothetical protein
LATEVVLLRKLGGNEVLIRNPPFVRLRRLGGKKNKGIRAAMVKFFG